MPSTVFGVGPTAVSDQTSNRSVRLNMCERSCTCRAFTAITRTARVNDNYMSDTARKKFHRRNRRLAFYLPERAPARNTAAGMVRRSELAISTHNHTYGVIPAQLHPLRFRIRKNHRIHPAVFWQARFAFPLHSMANNVVKLSKPFVVLCLEGSLRKCAPRPPAGAPFSRPGG